MGGNTERVATHWFKWSAHDGNAIGMQQTELWTFAVGSGYLPVACTAAAAPGFFLGEALAWAPRGFNPGGGRGFNPGGGARLLSGTKRLGTEGRVRSRSAAAAAAAAAHSRRHCCRRQSTQAKPAATPLRHRHGATTPNKAPQCARGCSVGAGRVCLPGVPRLHGRQRARLGSARHVRRRVSINVLYTYMP